MSWPLTVAFCTDGGTTIGLGHLRRCVTLANALTKLGCLVHFSISEDADSARFLRQHGITSYVGEADAARFNAARMRSRWSADAVVIDSYVATNGVFTQVPPPKLVAIDDVGDRALPVDLVVNAGAHARALQYRLAARTRELFGPRYAILRDEFVQLPPRTVRDRIERVLVSVGGADPYQLSASLVDWIGEILPTSAIDLVVGPFFDDALVRSLMAKEREGHGGLRLHREPSEMAPLMTACDLAITGGGQITYELAASGTPALVVRIAPNQTGNLRGLASMKTLEWVGNSTDPDLKTKIVKALAALAQSPERRARMSTAGREIVDGLGASRIASAIVAMCCE